MQLKSLAPVVLFVFNRPRHTKQALAFLKKNTLLKESALYIFSDGPGLNADCGEINRIKQVRQIIGSEKWCNTVIIEHSERNKGLANSVTYGVSKVMEKHGRAIILEDDIICSPYLLLYMNKALEYYKDDQNVGGIASISQSRHKGLDNYFSLPLFSSWGWATWRRVWDKREPDSSLLYNQILKDNLTYDFDFGGYPFMQMLKNQIEGKIDSWAIGFYAKVFLEKMIFLYPKYALAKNTGFDDSGRHCGSHDILQGRNISFRPKEFIFPPPRLKSKNVQIIRECYKDKLLKSGGNSLSIKGVLKRIKSKFRDWFRHA